MDSTTMPVAASGSDARPDAASGPLLAGRYRVQHELGAGGMGRVFLATDARLGREVVVKFLKSHLLGDLGAERRFQQEARAASALNHPHIVAVTDVGEDDAGTPFIVMEYLAGETLAAVVRQNGPLPWGWARTCALQMLDALEAAHSRGIIHRDVKPSNCMCVGYHNLQDRVHIKLLDFGIAKLRAESEEQGPLTSAGVVLGTLTYLSPEQARAANVDHRSDLYSLAVVLFELLTGRPPFLGRGPLELMLQHAHEPAPRLSDVFREVQVPAQVEAAIERALEKNPEHRFQSAREFAEVLDAAPLEGDSTGRRLRVTAPSPSPYYDFLTREALPVDDQEWFELRGLLEKVKRFWLDSVLARTEFGGVLLQQNRTVEFASVQSSWERQYRSIAPGDRARPSGEPQSRERPLEEAPLTEIFENLNRTLLILGEAGCGKTLNLLALARYLADRAGRHRSYREPVPVVFNLSSWASSLVDLTTWLSREFGSKYQIPRQLAIQWIRGHRIIPLLDGLDEISPAHRERCVHAINQFAMECLPPALVVTCRSVAYEQLDVRLAVNGALRLHPLTNEQVSSFFERDGARWAALRRAFAENQALLALARTPLMLNVMARSLGTAERLETFSGATETSLTERVYDAYLDEMRSRSGSPLSNADLQSMQAQLSWLARAMLENHQTVFRFEDMQPSWLDSRWLRLGYSLFTRCLAAALLGASSLLSFGLSPLENGGFRTSLAFAGRLAFFDTLVLGLGYGVSVAWAWRPAAIPNPIRVLLGLSKGVLLGALVALLASGGSRAPVVYVMGAEVGLAASVVFGFGRTHRTLEADIRVSESIAWHWTRFANALPLVLATTTLMFILAAWTAEARAGAYVAAVVFGIGSIIAGLEPAPPKPNDAPNRGIHRTLRNAGVTFGLAFGIATALFATSYGVGYGASVGLALGTFAGLRFGGFDALCHYTLRLLLRFESRVRLDLNRILVEASDLAILRKMGGGYMFMHRSLMDHLARSGPSLFVLVATAVLSSGIVTACHQPQPPSVARTKDLAPSAAHLAAIQSAPPTAKPLASSSIIASADCLDGFAKQPIKIDRPSGFAADIAAADVDGDGVTDLVIASGNDIGKASLAILYGPFQGSTPKRTWTSESDDYHRRLAVADANGDGVLDIAVALMPNTEDAEQKPSVALYLSSGGRLPRTPQRMNLGAPATSVAFGDVDADGDLDLAVIQSDLRTNPKPKPQLVLENDKGRFDPSRRWQSESEVVGLSCRFADTDGDGLLDLVVSQLTPEWCSVFHGARNDSGRVALSKSSTVSGDPSLGRVYAVDLEVLSRGTDKPTDILAALNNERCKASDPKRCETPRLVLRGPDGVNAWHSNETGMATAARIADVNLDGHPDLVIGTWLMDHGKKAPGPIDAYCGTEKDGEWQPARSLRGNYLTQGLAVMDIDGNGHVNKRVVLGGRPNSDAARAFVLDSGVVESVVRVERGGHSLDRRQYAFVPGRNWITFARPVRAGESIEVTYTLSTSPDIALVDEADSNHVTVYYNTAPAGSAPGAP